MDRRFGSVIVLVGLLAGCAGPAPSAEAVQMRFVALGDSYTIGTAVSEAERWPDQLIRSLDATAGAGRPNEPRLELVANLGVNGYTSDDLIRDELPALDALAPDIVSVLIGVNDIVQGVDPQTYEANLILILDALLARLPADRIVTIAIPDYTVTPAGGDYGDPSQQHEAIVAANALMARLSADRGIAFVDIFDISAEAASDRSLVADDGLHPSGVQYGRWVERIAPVFEAMLER